MGSVSYDANTTRHLEKVLRPERQSQQQPQPQQQLEPTIPPMVSEFYIRNSAERAAPNLFQMVLSSAFPDVNFIRSLVRLCWACASGRLELLFALPDELHKAIQQQAAAADGESPLSEQVIQVQIQVTQLVKELLELLAQCFVLVPGAFDILQKEANFKTFIIDMLLISKNRYILYEYAHFVLYLV